MLSLRPQDRQVRLEVFAETNPSADACTTDACAAYTCAAYTCTAYTCTAYTCALAEADTSTHTCTDAKAGPVWSCGDVRCAWHG